MILPNLGEAARESPVITEGQQEVRQIPRLVCLYFQGREGGVKESHPARVTYIQTPARHRSAISCRLLGSGARKVVDSIPIARPTYSRSIESRKEHLQVNDFLGVSEEIGSRAKTGQAQPSPGLAATGQSNKWMRTKTVPCWLESQRIAWFVHYVDNHAN